MADVSHTISGILLHPQMPEGQTCDYCTAPATVRLQGETDSFGAEWLDFCAYHAERVRAGATFTYCIECDALFELDDPESRVVQCPDHAASPHKDPS